MRSLKNAVLRAVNEYNKYRSPEAKVKLVKIDDSKLVLDFEGSFCRTCGVYDYLEDFIYEFRRFSRVNLEISNFKEYELEKIRVEYAIKP